MDANKFYEQWNNSIQQNVDSMEELDLFDDLDLLLDDEIIEKDSETLEIADIIANKNDNCDKSIKAFTFPVNATNNVQAVYNDLPLLQQSINNFCQQYDYEDLSALFGTGYSDEELILSWLRLRFAIVTDTAFDKTLLQYSEELLDQICPLYRSLNLSELLLIAAHIDKAYFDPMVIRDYSLEARDTGLLLELLSNSNFNRDEAILYTNNLDKYNSYLILKSSGKYDASSFNEVSKHAENLDAYTQTIMANSPFAFLGNHPNFNKILKFVQNNDVPVELARLYQDNLYLYEIIIANHNGLYNADLINNFLTSDNMYASYVADDYANVKLNPDVLMAYNGDYYLAKLVYDVKSFDCNAEAFLTDLGDYKVASVVRNFAKTLLDLVFANSVVKDEWYKFIYYLAVKRDYNMCNYISNNSIMSFNNYCLQNLLKELGLNANLPDDIGELILYQNGDKLSYLSVQMYWEASSAFVKVLKNKLASSCIKLLPEGYGIIICDKTYTGFSQEQSKFNWLKNSKSSLNYGIQLGKYNGTNRYNFIKILEIAQMNDYHISDSFRMLGEIVPEKYLMFDNLLNIVCTYFTEFAGLCTCSEALQCLKLFMSMLNYGEHGVVQIEFLKAYLNFKFNKRIHFEPYDKKLIQEIRYVEVKDSYNYEHSNIAKILSSLDNFTLELNKKHNIVCRFVGTNKIVFEGV